MGGGKIFMGVGSQGGVHAGDNVGELQANGLE